MEIPLYIFLYLYLGFVILGLVFAFFNIYHIIRFGTLNSTTVFSSFIFLIGVLIILWVSHQWLQGINWQQTIELF